MAKKLKMYFLFIKRFLCCLCYWEEEVSQKVGTAFWMVALQ